MKACITTHCVWSSFGSMLQALGLKKALRSLGCDSFLLTDLAQPEYRLRKPTNKKELFYFPKRCAFHGRFSASREKGVRFINNNLEEICFDSYNELKNNYPEADRYIAGSDQIWSPSSEKPLFFLEFVKNGSIKASYAASIGVNDIPAEKQERYKDYLSDFSFISVREQSAKAAISGLVDQEISVNIDPVFLIGADEWKRYEKEYSVKKPYILLYTIYWNDGMKDKLKNLSRRTGLPIYAVKPAPSRAYASKSLYDVGPEEFLWLIDNAEYVVTSSFHGAAFSAVFGKKVSVVINPSAPARLKELTDRLELPVIDIDKLDRVGEINYSIVEKNISAARKEGIEYLKRVLK